jgi:hypothetical protein
VIVDGVWELSPGDFIAVDVTGSQEHELIGEPPSD